MNENRHGVVGTVCTDCGASLRREATPGGVLVWCATCKENRCPLCGSWLQGIFCSCGMDWHCGLCHVYAAGPGRPVWPEHLLESAAFYREVDRYGIQHPKADLAQVSIELCAEIDRVTNLGVESDLCLVVMHVARLTGARMSPNGTGWRLRLARRALEVGADCTICLLHLATCGMWIDEEERLDFEEEDIPSIMYDWLRGVTQAAPPTLDTLRRCMHWVGRDDEAPSIWRERKRVW